MKDPDDPGTFDMASVWGEVLPPAKPVKPLNGKRVLPILTGDEQQKEPPSGAPQVDDPNGQDAG